MSESLLSSRLIGMKTTNPRVCSADVIPNSEKNHFPVWFFMARRDGLERETEAQSRVSGYWSHWQVWGWNHSTHAAPRATATGWRNPSWRTGNPWKFLVQTTYPMTMIQEFREGPWRQCCGNIFLTFLLPHPSFLMCVWCMWSHGESTEVKGQLCDVVFPPSTFTGIQLRFLGKRFICWAILSALSKSFS